MTINRVQNFSNLTSYSLITFGHIYIFFNLCVGNSQGILSYDVKCICMHMFPHFGPGVVLSVLNFFLKVTSAVEEIYLHFLTIRPFASMFFNK